MKNIILYQFLYEYLESRKDDLEKIKIAQKSYENILNYVDNVSDFNGVFKKSKEGYFYLLDKLGIRIRKEEHKNLKVYFMDRSLFGFKSKLNAKARTIRSGGPESKIVGYEIFLLFDAPKEVIINTKSYNEWFENNIFNILNDDKIKSSYIHEFTHVMDYKRVSPDYLAARTKKKKEEQEKQDNLKKDFSSYINDPLELNAYFKQAASDMLSDLDKLSPNEQQSFIGENPKLFIEKFLNQYLKPQAKKYITPENKNRYIKRIYLLWERLKEKNEFNT